MSLSILFVGGLGPTVTTNDLLEAFHPVALHALSVVRVPEGACIGHAYVTVSDEELLKARHVTSVAGNAVCIFPVTLESYQAPSPAAGVAADGTPSEAQEAATAAAEAGGHPAAMDAEQEGGVQQQQQQQQQLGQQQQQQQLPPAPHAALEAAGPLGQQQAAYGPSPATSAAAPPQYAWPAAAAAAPPAYAYGPAGGGAAAAGAAAATQHTEVALPTASPSHAHLAQTLEYVRAQLAASPLQAYNGKPWTMLLHEAAQKRALAMEVKEGADPHGFACHLTLLRGGAQLLAASAAAGSKRDAKAAASAACLEQMLATGQLQAWELTQAMLGSAPPQATVGAGAGAGGPGGGATPSMALTEAVLSRGQYPGCGAVMSRVYGRDAGRNKTILMVLNEFAAKHRLSARYEELAAPGPTGPFRFAAHVFGAAWGPQGGMVEAAAQGAECSSKQEAKQAAAAALIEELLLRQLADPARVAGV